MDFKETICYPISTVGQAAREGELDLLKQLIAEGMLLQRQRSIDQNEWSGANTGPLKNCIKLFTLYC